MTKTMALLDIKTLAQTPRFRLLRPFLRSPSYWEVLCNILVLDGDERYGIEDYIALGKAGTVKRLSLTSFLRAQVAAGVLNAKAGAKKSRKTLTPSPELIAEIEEYFRLRDTLLLSAGYRRDAAPAEDRQ